MNVLTDFQIQCEQELKRVLREYQLHLIDKRIEDGLETYIEAKISGSDLGVWIYEREVQLKGRNVNYIYEEQDFATPSELIMRFVQDTRKLLETRRQT